VDNIDIELRKHKFIVFSHDHYNPLNIIRSLGEQSLKPISILYGENQYMIPHCKYVSRLHQVKTIEEGYRILLQEYGSEDEKPFVFCSEDNTESYLDLHYKELNEHFFIYNSGSQGSVTRLQDKGVITTLAREVGLIIPNEEIVDRGILPITLKYPVITKTLSSTMGGWKKDVHICHDEKELIEAYKVIKSPKLCLQEFINKVGEFTVEAFSINDGNEVFMPYLIDYIRFSYDNYGFFMNVIPLENNVIKTKIAELIKRAKYNGIFEVEFMKGSDGECYFLEVNFRASTWNYALTVGGGNLPYYWAKSMLMGKIPYNEMELRVKPFRAMVEPADFKRNVKKIGVLNWLKDLRSSECLYYYNKKDRWPFFYYLLCSRRAEKNT